MVKIFVDKRDRLKMFDLHHLVSIFFYNLHRRKIFMLSVLIALTCFSTTGCAMHLNKIYDYKPTTVKRDWGKTAGKLTGNYKTVNDETIKGTPYELFFWFELSPKFKEVFGGVAITEVELYDTKNNVIVFSENDAEKSKFKIDSTGKQNAYFSFKDLPLSYVHYKLILKFKIETDKLVVEDTVILYFDTDYKEYRRNRLWERLMGV